MIEVHGSLPSLINNSGVGIVPMIGENRQLVTNEPVGFEK